MNTIQITKLAKTLFAAGLLVLGAVNASAQILPVSQQTRAAVPGDGGAVGGEQF